MSTEVADDIGAGAVADVVEYVFRLCPYIARRAGRHDFDAWLPEIAPRSSSELVPLRTAVSRQLDSLPPFKHAELRADLDTCLRLLDFERLRIEALVGAYQGPMDCAYEADISAYVSGDYAPLTERVGALHRHLLQLPEFLGKATQVLPPAIQAGERLTGIEWGRTQAANIRAVARQLGIECPEVADSLTSAAREAAAACEAYGQEIGARPPTKAQLGPERLAELLAVAEGVTQPISTLIDEVEAEVASLAAALSAACARIGAASPRDAYDMMLHRLPPESTMESLTHIIERLREFWAGTNVLPVHPTGPLELRNAGRIARSANVTFVVSPPLAAVRQPHLLYVPDPPLPTTSERPPAVWEYLNEPMLEMLAVHEAYAGHYVQVETALAGPSVLRTSVFWFTGFTEGWAHYVEELAIERGLAEERPLVELAQLRFAQEAAVRLLVFLSVHGGRMTLGEACQRAATICDWSPERATRDVLETISNRGHAMYTLGKLRIREWRQAAGVGTSAGALSAFHERLMRCGSAPLSTVWQYALDGQQAPATTG